MRFSKEMIAEDEKRWHARDVVTELGYCSTYMRDRKDMTNLDIRFYAYIMRKAHEMLKAQKPIPASIKDSDGGATHWYVCGSCQAPIQSGDNYCHECGKAVKWDG